jgi:alpha-tubulin suppressor-like RCC1 family protein
MNRSTAFLAVLLLPLSACGGESGAQLDASPGIDGAPAADAAPVRPRCDPGATSARAAVGVTAGNRYSCALLDNGAVRCWGLGDKGQLGYGNTGRVGDRWDMLPCDAGDVPVGGIVIQIAAGHDHTCALLDTGAVRCWGHGYVGQLGYGHDDNVGDRPGRLPSDAGDVEVGGAVTQIAVGDAHACALLDTGAVRCWGSGVIGRLGYGNTDAVGGAGDPLPSDAGDVNVGGTVSQIVAGREHTCALLDTGAVRCWGGAAAGQLGYGSTVPVGDREEMLPTDAGDVEVGGAVVQLAAGILHTCALVDTGAVRCWGWGQQGSLGYGNPDHVGDREDMLPSDVGDVNVGGQVVQIAAGGKHTCALTSTDTVRCWGWGLHGQLGYGNSYNVGDREDMVPSDAGDVEVGATVTQLALGGMHTCALLDTGAVRCWGRADDGQLGYGNTNGIGREEDNLPFRAGDVPLF